MNNYEQSFTETEFGEALSRVKREARDDGGCITSDRVRKIFEPLKLSDAQLDEVYTYLKASHIGVDEEPDVGEFLTESERGYLSEYIQSLSDIPEKTERELLRLSHLAIAGDASAQKELAVTLLKDVPDIARLYVSQGVSIEDLIGEGNLALYNAAALLGALEDSDASEVSRTLTHSVMDAMEELIAENLKEDARGQRAVNRVNEVADRARELYGDLRREVTVDELVAETGWERSKIEEAWRLSGGNIEELDGSAFLDSDNSAANTLKSC